MDKVELSEGAAMLIDRYDGLAMLRQLQSRQRGRELLLLYGRHRVGKTALLRH
jgi:AAA+ ATPase superfamily predicted ATPase